VAGRASAGLDALAPRVRLGQAHGGDRQTRSAGETITSPSRAVAGLICQPAPAGFVSTRQLVWPDNTHRGQPPPKIVVPMACSERPSDAGNERPKRGGLRQPPDPKNFATGYWAQPPSLSKGADRARCGRGSATD